MVEVGEFMAKKGLPKTERRREIHPDELAERVVRTASMIAIPCENFHD